MATYSLRPGLVTRTLFTVPPSTNTVAGTPWADESDATYADNEALYGRMAAPLPLPGGLDPAEAVSMTARIRYGKSLIAGVYGGNFSLRVKAFDGTLSVRHLWTVLDGVNDLEVAFLSSGWFGDPPYTVAHLLASGDPTIEFDFYSTGNTAPPWPASATRGLTVYRAELIVTTPSGGVPPVRKWPRNDGRGYATGARPADVTASRIVGTAP